MNARNIIMVMALGLGACRATSHGSEVGTLGVVRSSDELEAQLDAPGPVTVEVVNAADWSVDLSGLLNLESPEAKAAGLEDRLEPIQIYFYALRHPQHGLFIVDTGVERALRDAPERSALSGLVRSVMGIERMEVHQDTASYLEAQPGPLAGVFMTHIHLDHISGLPDVPTATPIYTGPGEAGARQVLNGFVQGSADRAFAGRPAIQEWPFASDAAGRFAGVVDIFGDGSIWAIHVPGHTPGSTAYLVRTPSGPVLLVGDTCHTAWGWDHRVEPGSFTADQAQNAASLGKLLDLVARHPSIEVHLGHQAATHSVATR